MYRPMILMASDHQSTTQDSPGFGSQDFKTPEPTTKTKTSTSNKGRSRKSTARPKRPNPQRGVGVAQLERLRMQQRPVGVTRLPLPQHQPQNQVVQNVTLPDNQQRQFQYYQNQETLPDPLLSIPVLYGASNYDGAMSGGSGLVGFDRNGLFVQTVNGNVGGSAGFGFGYNVRRLHNDVGGLVMEPNQYGVVGAGVVQNRGAVYEISNELSSIPRMKQQQPSSSSSSEYCCCCKQKKRFNCGNNMDFGESPTVFPVVNSSDLPGINQQQNTPNVRLAGETGSGFSGGTYLSRRPSVADESVEVRAVHRKGRQAGGDIMMEYEFFPDLNNNNSSSVVSSGTYPMDHELVASSTNSSSVGRSSEASNQHLGATCIEGADMMMMMMSSGYSPVDLSLKLSF